MIEPQAAAVHAFWFGSDERAGTKLQPRPQWFRKDAAFDREIAERFGRCIEQALAGELQDWAQGDGRSRLALILVLDQFTRNAYRDSARMYAGDQQALALAGELVDQGLDRALDPLERSFAYLPFEHSESLEDQDRSMCLFESLRAHATTASAYDWAQKHRDIVLRFGRFPHRNAILARESTADEIAFLATPGSRF